MPDGLAAMNILHWGDSCETAPPVGGVESLALHILIARQGIASVDDREMALGLCSVAHEGDPHVTLGPHTPLITALSSLPIDCALARDGFSFLAEGCAMPGQRIRA